MSGTCVKNTWTKPRGLGSRVGGEDGWGRWQWWEGNGDYLNNNKNYKKIKIKYLKKNKKGGSANFMLSRLREVNSFHLLEVISFSYKLLI